jgi:hypothetical protein
VIPDECTDARLDIIAHDPTEGRSPTSGPLKIGRIRVGIHKRFPVVGVRHLWCVDELLASVAGRRSGLEPPRLVAERLNIRLRDTLLSHGVNVRGDLVAG